SIRGPNLVEHGNRFGARISADGLVLLALVTLVADSVGDSTTEDDEIEEGVGTKTVSAVDGDTSGFTGGIETRNDNIVALIVDRQDFTGVLGRDTTHVVV